MLNGYITIFEYDVELIDNLCIVLDSRYNIDCFGIYYKIKNKLLALK